MPVVAGVEITTNTRDLWSLNAVHRASGGGSNKAPAQWLRTQMAKDLIAELKKPMCRYAYRHRKEGQARRVRLLTNY